MHFIYLISFTSFILCYLFISIIFLYSYYLFNLFSLLLSWFIFFYSFHLFPFFSFVLTYFPVYFKLIFLHFKFIYLLCKPCEYSMNIGVTILCTGRDIAYLPRDNANDITAPWRLFLHTFSSRLSTSYFSSVFFPSPFINYICVLAPECGRCQFFLLLFTCNLSCKNKLKAYLTFSCTRILNGWIFYGL